jgi:hypothetical protein
MELMGLSEVAIELGVSVRRAHQLQAEDRFPQTLARLRCGPIWEAEDIRAFLATWDRSPGRRKKNS